MPQPDRFKLVREGVRKISELSNVKIPRFVAKAELDRMESKNRRWEEMDESNDWIRACHEVLNILTEMEGQVTYDETIRKNTSPEEETEWSVEFTNRNDYMILGSSITSWGNQFIVAEYLVNGSWEVLWEGLVQQNQPNPMDLTLEVVCEELAYLTKITQSSKISLDYWQTALSPKEYSQTSWADVRGVQRQTVNDSIRTAENALEESSEGQ